MQALVTGGSGFIGSEVIRQLIKQGISVRALLRTTSSRKYLSDLNIEESIGDLNDFDSLKKAVQGVDYVFHLAGVISTRVRENYFKYNQIGTKNLAQACAEVNSKLKRFVYVSSLAACGPSNVLVPKTEKDLEAPISDYGASKLMGEKELLKFKDHFPITILRPPAVYGPRDKGIFEFIKIVNSGFMPLLPTKIKGGEKHYSLIYVEDLVKAIVQCGLADSQENGSKRRQQDLFFISNDETYAFSEVLGVMAKVLNKKSRKVRIPNFALKSIALVYTTAGYVLKKEFPLTLDKLKELNPDFWICSNKLVKEELGFKPQYSLEAGLTKSIQWYKDHGWLK